VSTLDEEALADLVLHGAPVTRFADDVVVLVTGFNPDPPDTGTVADRDGPVPVALTSAYGAQLAR
jgi:hypothetical protein